MMNQMMSRGRLVTRRRGAKKFALALAITAPVIGTAIAQQTEVTSSEFAAAVNALASQVRSEILRLPADSSVETFEAAILFVVDQSGQPENVVCAAFDIVRPEATTPANAKPAMDNVCRNLRRGTGAIPNNGANAGPAGFSAPTIGGGGGGSGYTP